MDEKKFSNRISRFRDYPLHTNCRYFIISVDKTMSFSGLLTVRIRKAVTGRLLRCS